MTTNPVRMRGYSSSIYKRSELSFWSYKKPRLSSIISSLLVLISLTKRSNAFFHLLLSLSTSSMPQVDLSVCADRKIACESTRPYNSTVSRSDCPPESYFLSKDAQLEWLSDNAFFERKDSQRGNSANPNSNPSSQRFLLKSKMSIIGLPRPQKTCFNGGRIDKNRLIVGSRIKTDTSLLEPSSPKVSCIGRVRSKRERSRRMHRQRSGRPDPFEDLVKKPGFLASFRAIFRVRGGCKNVLSPPSRTNDIRSRLPREDVNKCSVVGGAQS